MENFKRFYSILFYSILFVSSVIFVEPAWGQSHSVLVDDAPMCGWHDRYTYQVLWDTLTSAGCTVDFTTDVGRYPSLSSYDFVVLMHHGDCASAGFSYDQRTQLIDFVCSGGQVLIMPMGDLEPLNEFLSDSRWNTGIQLTYGGAFTHTTCIADFPPLTDGISYLEWEVDAELLVNSPAYPFVWDDACERVLAAVSYPQGLGDFECNVCETGGRIIVIGENHTYEYEVVGYVEPMNYRFIVNILTSLAGVGDTLDPCEPPDIPRLDSIPCIEPGDVANLYGGNIPSDANLYFDGSPLSFTWLDSTHITFVVPDSAVQGYHTVTVEVEGIPFNIQIQVYCEWLDILDIEPYCADIGDTIWFSGENFSVSATMTFGGAPLSDYAITSDTSGWFIVPDTAGLIGYLSIGQSYRYQVCIQNEPTQFDCEWMLVPCSCPPDSEIAARIVNLRFWERTDGTDTVYIVYDLIADTAQNIVLWCSSDGGFTWDVPCTTLYGAIGAGVAPGESLVIVWSAGEDVPDTESSDWVFRIDITDTTVWDSTMIGNLFATAVGETSWDYGYSVVQTGDGGYAVTGWTNSSGAGEWDLFLVKFNPLGAVEWARAVGGTDNDGGSSVVQTSDGGYAVAGWTHSFGVGGSDFFLVKFSSLGAFEWARTVGGTNYEDSCSVVQTSDGGYAVAGYTNSFGAGGDDLFLVKFSSAGAFEWARAVGGTGNDEGSSVVQTSDGGFALAGVTAGFGAGGDDLFLVKFSSAGAFEWARAVGGTGDDEGSSVIQTSDGGYAVAGETYSFGAGNTDFFLVKFSLSGAFEWARAVGGTDYDYGESVVQTNDGGYAVAGLTSSFGVGIYDLFLVKFDDMGNSCIGDSVSPTITTPSPTVTSPSPDVASPSPTVTVVSPTVTDVTPAETLICSFEIFCPYGAVYASGESDPGPVDTWCPRITATCPPGGRVGDPATITWTVEDSFIPPLTLGPAYPIELWFSLNGGATWDFIGASDNDGSFNWAYPPELTSSGMIMVCAADSFGHQCCDTCGTFSITGDIINPWGYAYADTCSPDSVFFILHDDHGIDWSSVCIQDPLGVLCYPDSMTLVGDTMLIFHPRLPDSIMDATRYFYVRLWSAQDSSGNDVPEMLVDDSLTVQFRHPCCYPAVVWRECPPDEWNGWSSCPDQSVTFGIMDTTGQGIDTTRIFVRQSIDGIESNISADSLLFGHSGDTLWVIVPSNYSDLDSVWIMLDSLFTVPGCETDF